MGVIERLTEGLELSWETRRAKTARAVILILTLLGGIVLVEIERLTDLKLLPEGSPTVHLAAISWAIYLLLIFEFVEMAFAMSNSVAASVGRHLQLYSLVLLRDAFLKLGEFPEPIEVTGDDLYNIGIMTSDAGGAVLLFLAATVFARLQRHTPIAQDDRARESFKAFKQGMVLLLLGTLVGLCLYRVTAFVLDAAFSVDLPAFDIIDAYFTVLVFADVLLAFASLAIADNPAIVFRNFGFAFVAILLRLSLASPEFIRPGLGVAAAIVALAVTLVYNLDPKVHRQIEQDQISSEAED